MKKIPNQKYKPRLTEYIYLFFVTAIGGFLWEVLIYLVQEGQFRKRGFFYGPWLPIYGVGGVLMLLLLHRLRDRPVSCFFLSALIGSLVELIIGWMLDTFWGLRYWDYSNNFLNLNGYICFYSCFAFGIIGALWVCFLCRVLMDLWTKIPKHVQKILIITFVSIFAIDIVVALIVPNVGMGITY